MDFNKFSTGSIESLTVQVQIEDAPYVSTTSNPGNMRVNADAAKILGVDYTRVNTTDKDDPGVRMEFGARNWNGIESKLVYIMPLGSKQGSKLASPSRQNGGVLQCSSGNAWKQLDGNKDVLKWYTVNAADNAVAFAEDGSALSLEQAKEHGLIADGLWTELAAQHGLGTAGEVPTVYFLLTYAKETAKRQVTGVTGRPKATKTTQETPFAEKAVEEAVEEVNTDVSSDDVKEDDFEL